MGAKRFYGCQDVGPGALIVLGLTVAFDKEAVAQNFSLPWAGITETSQFHEVSKFMPWAPLAAVMVLCGAMVGSLFSADAWHNVTFTAGEVRDPKRNLPRSLVMGTGLVIVLYLLANCAYLTALPLSGREPETNAPRNVVAFERGIDHAKDDRVGTAVLERVSPRSAYR